MTPQRERAVERVRKLMDWEPDWVEEMMATTVPDFAEEREITKTAVFGWERAIVAEGLLEDAASTLRLIADLDDQNYDDSQFVSFCLNRIRHNVLPRLAEIRSFLSAEGE